MLRTCSLASGTNDQLVGQRDYHHRNVHWTLPCEGIQLADFACSRSNTLDRSELSRERTLSWRLHEDSERIS